MSCQNSSWARFHEKCHSLFDFCQGYSERLTPALQVNTAKLKAINFFRDPSTSVRLRMHEFVRARVQYEYLRF